MSMTYITAQGQATMLTFAYCGNAVSALLIYDWLLCLGQEVRFIWGRHSVVTVASVVYLLSRYAMLIQYVVTITTNFPMSDLSCTASGWIVNVSEILYMLAFSAFSALRVYALSNRNPWLTTLIFLLVLPTIASYITQCIYRQPVNQPSPFNCGALDSESPTLSKSLGIVSRVTVFVAELVAVSLSWWYSYQSYRIAKDINFGNTISAFFLYNGSIYFLFIAALYILDIIFFHVVSLPETVANAHTFLVMFYDPIISIVMCRFMLSLRQFDARMASMANSELGSQAREYRTSSTTLHFATRASHSLPGFLASFAHPVHTESVLEESGEFIDDELELWREWDAVAPTQNMENVILHESGP